MQDKKYKVRFQKDDTYQVVEEYEITSGDWHYTVLFSGTLADCEAWIRLTEKGYM